MKDCLGVRWISSALFVAALLLLLSAAAQGQTTSEESPGINSGGYNIHQNIEFGYRLNEINGNQNTYDTFENLGSGLRLFDFTLEMRSIDHQGFLFDTLSMSNFGYGGDPNDVTRLRVEKNKWYDFRLLFRRDKNFWDYNLWANPLNPAALNPAGSLTTGCYVGAPTMTYPQGAPAYCSNPAVPQNNSAHALDLVRRMQDYDLTLLPQSAVRFRLGYSRNRNEGPSLFTTDGTTISPFQEAVSNTTNAYRAGIDVRILPRTTVSFDEFLTYYKQDNVITDNPDVNPGNFGFILGTVAGQGTPAGTPVDLGNIWSTQSPKVLPCATPIVTGTTNTATPTCAGFLSYSLLGKPRNFMPTERLRFQSNYFKNFEMSGSLGYSSGDYHFSDLAVNDNSWANRSAQRGDTAAGPIKTTRVSVNADWSGVYTVTEKLRILDTFRYDNWRIPGVWDSAETNVFGTPAPNPNVVGLLLAPGVFNATNCPIAPYNQANCPSHTASSAADVSNGISEQFLGQNIKSNTFELEYDFNRRYSAHIGYLYTNRAIASSQSTFDTGQYYFPGGTDGTMANFWDAARGDCAPLSGGGLPAACTLITTGNLAGAIMEGSPSNPTLVTGDTSRSVITINENALLLGFVAHPIDALRVTGDFEFGYNDQSFTRIDPRQVQSYKIHINYKPRPWANVDGGVEIHENRDNVTTVNNIEHDNAYNFAVILMANPRISVDFGFNYWNVYSQTLICFAYSISGVSTFPPGVPQLPGGTACPISGSPSPLGALSTYNSTDYFTHAAVIWRPMKRVTATVGYGGSFVRGNTIFLNPLTPSGTLDFNYQRPYASLAINVYRGFSYITSWNYYGYNQTGNTTPFGLAAIQSPDYNGNNATFSLRYSF